MNPNDTNSVRRPPTPRNAAGRKWYQVRNASGDAVEILIYDYIGWPFIEAVQFVRDLAAITANEINVRINSPGGDVFDGLAIHNALKRHPATINVAIDGLAASTASWVAMAGDTITIAPNAYMMMHDPEAVAFGGAEDFRKRADWLDQVRDTIAQMYAERAGKSVEDFQPLMAAETWFTADEAVNEGLADEVSNSSAAPAPSNGFDLSTYNRVPEPLMHSAGSRHQNTKPPKTIRDVENILRDAGLSNAAAKAIASNGFKASTDPRDEAGELLSLIRSHVAATT